MHLARTDKKDSREDYRKFPEEKFLFVGRGLANNCVLKYCLSMQIIVEFSLVNLENLFPKDEYKFLVKISVLVCVPALIDWKANQMKTKDERKQPTQHRQFAVQHFDRFLRLWNVDRFLHSWTWNQNKQFFVLLNWKLWKLFSYFEMKANYKSEGKRNRKRWKMDAKLY